jgi:hypothetical protein
MRGFSSDHSVIGSSALTLVLVLTGVVSLSLGAIYESGIFGSTHFWGFSLGADPKHALFAPKLLRTPTTSMYSYTYCLKALAHLTCQ